MLPSSKQKHFPSSMVDKKKREREKERARLGASKKKVPSDAKARFGKTFQSKLCELLLSDDPNAGAQMRAMYEEVAAYYDEHQLTEMWLSDDESDTREKVPISKKMHQDSKVEPRAVTAVRTRPSIDEKEKLKATPVHVPVPSSSAATSSSTTPFAQFEMSDDSEEEPAKKRPSHPSKNFKLCEVCSDGTCTPTNTLMECEDCNNLVHQKCSRPEVTPYQAKDPRFVFVCFQCKDRELPKNEKNGNGSGGAAAKPLPTLIVKKDIVTQKATSDLSATFASFAAKKKNKPSTTPGYGSFANSVSAPRPNPLNSASKNFLSFKK